MDSEKILKEYGHVLELTSGHTATAERFLPYPKDRIKVAIIAALIQEKEKKQVEALIGGFVRLATFISDEDATVVARFESLMLNKAFKVDVIHKKDASLQERYSQIQKNIVKEMEKLSNEISSI